MKRQDYRPGLKVVSSGKPLDGSRPNPPGVTEGEPWREGVLHYCKVRTPDGRVFDRCLLRLKVLEESHG
jgi:hypothetical protein